MWDVLHIQAHGDLSIHLERERESLGDIKSGMTVQHTGFTRFYSACKTIICCSFKHSSYWSSADVKPMSSDLVHANVSSKSCLLSISLCANYDIYGLGSVL